MTCIVGLEHEGQVYMAGDSAGVGHYALQIRKDEKVFVRENRIIMGFTSSFRMGQILRYSLKIPDHDPRLNDIEYLVNIFVNALRKCFKDNGYGNTGETDGDRGGEFLLGYKGKLYHICESYQVACLYDEYYAVGCGYDLALGSMFTTEQYDIGPEERLNIALDAASHFSAGVHGPYNILKI